jgi:4-aminobutyrate aminotransferase
LLIVDEVQSGVGRTGKWWAIEHWDVEPDIVCFAKGIASGVPMGGIVARESVMDWPEGAHSNTYGGNPLACSAALATLELVEEELLVNAQNMGEYAMDALEEMQSRHQSIGQVRGRGLMIGVEFIEEDGAKQPAHDFRERIVEEAFNRGLLLLGCGTSTIRLAPALNIDEGLLDEGLRIMEESISTVSK